MGYRVAQVVRHDRTGQHLGQHRRGPGVPRPGQGLERAAQRRRTPLPVPYAKLGTAGHQRVEVVRRRHGQLEELDQDGDRRVMQPVFLGAQLGTDEGDRLRAARTPLAEQPCRHPHGVAPVERIRAVQLPAQQGDPVGDPAAERGVQRPHQLGALLVRGAQAPQPAGERVRAGTVARVAGAGVFPGSVPEQPDDGRYEIGGK